ncbi:glycosyltransferase family 4 protein [Achromobacter insolitus]|uniref:glycosyltransferase family 4 protein n=1 Tax=Achromobacter insolitus TaxID=217204 RepID=UPI00241CE85C|nr:glycosyltransferase family 4 protein [Achromobacter insolitus]
MSLSSGFNGKELRILSEMLAMRERGHMLEVVCAARCELGRRSQSHGFTTHYIEVDGLFASAVIPFRIGGIVRGGDFDVVNTHSVADDLRAAPFTRLARSRLRVRTHHRESGQRVPRLRNVVSDHVITVSTYQRQRYLERGHFEQSVRTIPTGLDIQYHRPAAPSMRQELGIPEDAIVIGNVADDRDAQGLRILVEAMYPLMEVHPEVHLVLSGLHEPRLDQLRRRALEIGLIGRIHFPDCFLCVRDLLSAVDIYAMVPECEVLGSTFVEASACGVPVVATAVGCLPEVIENGVSGYVVLPFDRLILRSVIGKLIVDSRLRNQFGKAGRANFVLRERFSAATMAEAMEDAYLGWLNLGPDNAGVGR